MKLFLAVMLLVSAPSVDVGKPELSFFDNVISFPDTNEGEMLYAHFKFENTGDEPLVFTDYKVACSCTKAILPKLPVLPGEKGEVLVTFDTNDKYGYQSRVIAIHSNARKSVAKIKIKVIVIPKEDQE